MYLLFQQTIDPITVDEFKKKVYSMKINRYSNYRVIFVLHDIGNDEAASAICEG
jgi:hypothetical protein